MDEEVVRALSPYPLAALPRQQDPGPGRLGRAVSERLTSLFSRRSVGTLQSCRVPQRSETGVCTAPQATNQQSQLCVTVGIGFVWVTTK